MSRSSVRKITILIWVFLALWLGLKFLLPVAFPFILGGLLALCAEPAVKFLNRRLRLPRGAASFTGVSIALSLLFAALSLIISFFVRELGMITASFPNIEETIQQGLLRLQDFLLQLTSRTPENIQPLLNRTVLGLLGSSTALLEQASGWLSGLVSGILSLLPDGFLAIGTTLIAAFLISARLPLLKEWLHQHIPDRWKETYTQGLHFLKHSVWGWLKAQLKLSALTLCIVAAGLLVLQVSYAPLWAVAVALVDAVPILGTGTILIPWAIICLLQGSTFRAVGLGGIYIIVVLVRSILEPRLLGKHLGLDPLVTLLAMYAGYQIWGIGGMILAPMLAVAATQLASHGNPQPE